jgi:hypothetical protein
VAWFNRVKHEFIPRVMPYAGKPITYVEIGVWQGITARWMCEKILTHPQSHGIGIDPYLKVGRHTPEQMLEVKRKAEENLAPYGQWSWLFADSKRAMRRWRRPIDILYLDGMHEAPQVMQDFALAFPYMREGGLVIFDDFEIGQRKRVPCVPEAVAAILIAFDGAIEPLEGNVLQFACRINCKPNNIIDWYKIVKNKYHNGSFAMDVIEAKVENHKKRKSKT